MIPDAYLLFFVTMVLIYVFSDSLFGLFTMFIFAYLERNNLVASVSSESDAFNVTLFTIAGIFAFGSMVVWVYYDRKNHKNNKNNNTEEE